MANQGHQVIASDQNPVLINFYQCVNDDIHCLVKHVSKYASQVELEFTHWKEEIALNGIPNSDLLEKIIFNYPSSGII